MTRDTIVMPELESLEKSNWRRLNEASIAQDVREAKKALATCVRINNARRDFFRLGYMLKALRESNRGLAAQVEQI